MNTLGLPEAIDDPHATESPIRPLGIPLACTFGDPDAATLG